MTGSQSTPEAQPRAADQFGFIARHRGLIAVWGIIGVVLALVSVLTSTTTYSASTTVFVGSSTQEGGSSPEQDATAARAYVEFINNEANQEPLRFQAKTPPEVTISASAIADGPMIYVTARSSDEEPVIEASREFATAWQRSFQDMFARQFEAAGKSFQDRLLANQQEIAKERERLEAPNTTDAERTQAESRIEALNAENRAILSQIEGLSGTVVNSRALTLYQPATAVETESRGMRRSLVVGLLGGLLLGCVLAYLLDARRRTQV